jgi:hypothetical protein
VAPLLVEDRSWKAVEIIEQFADAAATDRDLRVASLLAREAHLTCNRYGFSGYLHAAEVVHVMTANDPTWIHFSLLSHAKSAAMKAVEAVAAQAAHAAGYGTLEPVTDPPKVAYAAATVARKEERAAQVALLLCIFGNPFRPTPSMDPAVLAWERGTVVNLAHLAYAERVLPSGTLDPTRLAVLADALEDAGCTDPDLLGHLRSPGPHTRGCWALDPCLGKG